MSRVVRISEEAYKVLEQNAKPFETPAQVLDRLLKIKQKCTPEKD
jgi:hypothetical protein